MSHDVARPLHHIALERDWQQAQAAGQYRVSTLDRTLDEVGFIHAAYAEQWEGVRERHYGGVVARLVLLVIDPDRLSSPVRVEPDPVTGQSFPHVYGPIDVDAVVEVRRLPRRVGAAVRHDLPDIARDIGRGLVTRLVVWAVVLGLVVAGALVGAQVDDAAGLLLGGAVGLCVALPVALLLGARLQRRHPDGGGPTAQ